MVFTDDLRVQHVNHAGGQRSYLILDVASGAVHNRADRYLAGLGEGTQRTYAYHLVDHLRWSRVTKQREERVSIADLGRYMALCGAHHSGPFGHPLWLRTPVKSATATATGVGSLLELDATNIHWSTQARTINRIVQALRTDIDPVHYFRSDTRERGYLDTDHWGFRFPDRHSVFDLTAIQ